MCAVGRVRPGAVAATLALLILAGSAAPAAADLRITDLDIYLNDQELTVHVTLLGVVPVGFTEGIQSGIPAHVRYTVELWQYNRFWPNRLLLRKIVERQLAYNVITKEFKVTSLRGEMLAPYVTREMRDATRVLSEVQGLKLTPATGLEPTDIFYVRVLAETALNGENTFVTRMAGTAEQTVRDSDFRTIERSQ